MADQDLRELYGKGLAQQNAGQTKAALQIYHVVLRRGGGDPSLFVRCGECYEALGDFAHADEAYAKAIAADPELDIARHRAAALALRGREFALQLGKTEAAEQLRMGAVSYLAGLGERLIARRAFADAEAAFRAAAKIAPDYWALHADLGRCLYEQGQFPAAEKAIRHGLGLAPAGAGALGHYHLGLLLERQDRREEAADAFRRALELDPGLALAQVALARLAGEP